ncbi:metallophosphoesterase [Bradyrhizobium sp. AZCC 2289]|uniref:metallophosphoesterase n=1 Tax=Bradyrhizobium sp. AZCC 2289 TaxID=3117026 RepID=UPI002FF3DB86
MNIWFTSDHHFGHKRIIELAQRPFTSVEEMDEMMIWYWNDRVKPGDMVYHVGDFAFADHDPYLDRLNGVKRLILGNRDHSNRWKTGFSKRSSTVDSLLHIALPDACHFAVRVWNRAHHGTIHLVHRHDNLRGDSQSCELGVDCWNFAPAGIEEIKAPWLGRERLNVRMAKSNSAAARQRAPPAR